MSSHRLSLVVILITISLPSIAQEKVQQQIKVQNAESRAVPETHVQKDQIEVNQAREDLNLIQDRQKKLTAAIRKFDELIRRKPPESLTRRQLTEWNEQTKWLKSVRDRYQEMDAAYSPSRQRAPATDMAKLNMQFLALQNAVQMESRKFQTLSSASKARHDIAMAAIRNTRA